MLKGKNVLYPLPFLIWHREATTCSREKWWKCLNVKGGLFDVNQVTRMNHRPEVIKSISMKGGWQIGKKMTLENETITVGYLASHIYSDTGSDTLATAAMTKPRETDPRVAWVEPLVRPGLCCLGYISGFPNTTTTFRPPFINNHLRAHLPSCFSSWEQEHKLSDGGRRLRRRWRQYFSCVHSAPTSRLKICDHGLAHPFQPTDWH